MSDRVAKLRQSEKNHMLNDPNQPRPRRLKPSPAEAITQAGRSPVTGIELSPDEVARLAYRLWQDRGRPEGSPEVDWFRAEQELRQKR